MANFCQCLAFKRFAFNWPVSLGCGGDALRLQWIFDDSSFILDAILDKIFISLTL